MLWGPELKKYYFEKDIKNSTLKLNMFAQGGQFMKQNAYVSKDTNQRERVATPTNFSIFDSYDMKSL